MLVLIFDFYLPKEHITIHKYKKSYKIRNGVNIYLLARKKKHFWFSF